MALKAGLIALLGFLLILAASAQAEKGRIYGKIYTDRGDILEGPIRWDKNEASWDDMLDGYKEKSRKTDQEKRRKYRDRSSQIRIFGLTIYKDGGSWSS